MRKLTNVFSRQSAVADSAARSPKRRRRSVAATALGSAALLLGVSACGNAASSGPSNEISYWLWDSSQQPAYQQCADAFHKENPALTVKITQYGWNDYWSKLTAGFMADTAPDVFTAHLNYYAQYASLGVLVPLDTLPELKDVKDTDYQPGLAQLWKGENGHRYGTPKDWDTISWFYDKKALAAAGITEQQLDTATWNPTDGGTFEKIVAHLTIDANGKRGDEPGFDKNHVKTYGFGSNGAGGVGWGQTQWSAFTGSIGWQATDKNPWGTKFNLTDKSFQSTISWYFGLQKKGYMPSFNQIGGRNAVGPDKQMQTGLSSTGFNGSWMLSTYANLQDANGKKIDVGIAPTPIGPSGKRASMFNGLADSITKQAKNLPAAAKWVKFLSGEECQDIVGKSGAVFPARPAADDLAVEFEKSARGFDVSPFTDQVKDHTTFLMPVTNNAADINALMGPTFDSIYIGDQSAASLTTLNTQLNNLMKVAQ